MEHQGHSNYRHEAEDGCIDQNTYLLYNSAQNKNRKSILLMRRLKYDKC